MNDFNLNTMGFLRDIFQSNAILLSSWIEYGGRAKKDNYESRCYALRENYRWDNLKFGNETVTKMRWGLHAQTWKSCVGTNGRR